MPVMSRRPVFSRQTRGGLALLGGAAAVLRSLALALCVAGVATEASSIRGVGPQDLSRYPDAAGASAFRCLSTPEGAALPLDAINDDFCDCADGSDEPGTGACAGQSTTMFYCPNPGSFPSYVYASRVNDGVCDCCDGSDEWRSTVCRDTCAVDQRPPKGQHHH
mmetsp:Transcript_143550/g.459106  ORF Transcript_143550/g.459106 Transcript_143550/m.459106 type:complete len:164 (-) Transcript_143550:23-514(-)